MRLITLEEAKAGDICAVDIRNAKNVLLVSSGSVLTEKLIQGLKAYNFSSIYIDDEISAGIETSFALKDKTIKKIITALAKQDIDQLTVLSKALVTELSTDLFENDMRMIGDYDSYTQQHSLNVATYATVLSKAIGLTPKTSELVAQAGLLHDIGKLQIAPDIIQKPGKLTNEEYDIVKTHAELGYQTLLDRQDVWSVVRVGVKEHHENEDGSGYPMKLTGDKIHTIGKLLHIADVFDALTTKRSYKDAWSYFDALNYITEQAGKMFDVTYSAVFQRCIPLYPKGTFVTLNTGVQAIVMKNYVADPRRPMVRTIDGDVINLLTDGQYSHIYIVNEK